MRLRQLKLAGFKSFVDPIVVPFPSQLVAVVGPNGCGKSNIIDAVRWVLGESHARQLRGESMVDVIFKGSTHRKSVGQASVELIFENSLGRLSGPYASYQEIAIKRIVTRDGESAFFLNGTRVRRRDITDIFLGTGAGARSYSIIGQDTISKLIEARPEELRVYLEEAGGVSKYKERRRETMHRIEQTRENLSRVVDIQQELNTQLARLEQQANAAMSYLALKQEERQGRLAILGLKWHKLMLDCRQIQVQREVIHSQQMNHQTTLATQHQTKISLQEALDTAQMDWQQHQAVFYQLAAEIARLDEAIQQQVRDKRQLALDRQQFQVERQQIEQQLQQDQALYQEVETNLQVVQFNLQAKQACMINEQQALAAYEQEEMQLNLAWQSALTTLYEADQHQQLLDMRLQQITERHQQLQISLERKQSDKASIDIEQLLRNVETQQAAKIHLEAKQADVAQQYQQQVLSGRELRATLQTIEQQLREAQDSLQATTIEQARLFALQQTMLQCSPSILPDEPHQSRVVEGLQVDEPWIRLVECMLGDHLQAILVDSIDALSSLLPSLQRQTGIYTESIQSHHDALSHPDRPTLAEKLSGVVPCSLLSLKHIFAADKLAQALDWLPDLHEHQSTITQDGYWLGPGWIRVVNIEPTTADEVGLLSRQQALTTLKVKLDAEQGIVRQLTQQRDDAHASLVRHEQEQCTLKEQLDHHLETLHTCSILFQQKKQAYDHAVSELKRIAEAQLDLQTEMELSIEQQLQLEAQKEVATQTYLDSVTKQQALISNKANVEAHVKAAKQTVETTQLTTHELALQQTKQTAKLQYIEANIKQAKQQQDVLQTRLQVLNQREVALNEPNSTAQEKLHKKTQDYQCIEQQLTVKQDEVHALQQRLQETEQLCQYEERQIKAHQLKQQQCQLEEQTVTTKASGLVELLDELDKNWRTMSIDGSGDIKKMEHHLAKIELEIQQLGPINLLAVEEYQANLQRKEHLDGQFQDLNEALAALERAIAKMDQQTKIRLQETFEQVNSAFQVLFPKLFGGGQAQLELTCDNLLEAGILVMAKPPGKRNNTIYMLSGGEKAMTAVALLFAIFQLNPSPFCMLDEIDAPLDDANIRRFCDLVKEMSQVVQFIVVTHNKVTMALADHLIGVTMREPGVSRIVTVDVAQQERDVMKITHDVMTT